MTTVLDTRTKVLDAEGAIFDEGTEWIDELVTTLEWIDELLTTVKLVDALAKIEGAKTGKKQLCE